MPGYEVGGRRRVYQNWRVLCLGLFLSDTGLEAHKHAAPLASHSLQGLVSINVQTRHLKKQQTKPKTPFPKNTSPALHVFLHGISEGKSLFGSHQAALDLLGTEV